MKKPRKITLFAVIFCFPLYLGLGSCCEELQSLADLLIKAYQAPTTITVGEIFDCTSDVLNAEEGGLNKCTETNISEITNYLCKILMRDTSIPESQWPVLYENSNFNVPALTPDQIAQLLFQLQINQAGNYRFQGYVDYSQEVQERNELNNGWNGLTIKSGISGSTTANQYLNIDFTVIPNEKGEKVIKNRPAVELIKYEVKILN